MRRLRDILTADEAAERHQRVLLVLAGTVYGCWWLVVQTLLPRAFNPLGGRLAVVALFFLTWAASYRLAFVRRRLEAFYGLCACVLMTHYYYLFRHNAGDPNWVAGAYITVLAVGVTVETWPFLLLFGVIVLAGTWLAESHDASNLVALPGTVTVLILINLVGFLRRKGDRERRARLEAEKERAVAEAAGRMRLSFLANMSHELRTPLTSIAGFSELLAEAPELSADSRQVLERVRVNTRILSEMVVQILTLTESDLSPFELRAAPFEVKAEIAEAAAAVRSLPPAVVYAEPFPAVASGDRKQWRRILDAVLSNAAKFTAPEGRIDVAVSRLGDLVRVDVTDTGVGIDPADWEDCFGVFKQLRDDYSRPYGGAGLGLTVARRLARAMGGDVTIVASALGKGTTVRIEVSLPTR
jgi:signal transduction histidine kinase